MRHYGLFSNEADELVAHAMRWLEDRRLTPVEPVVRIRAYRPAMRFSSEETRLLRTLADSTGWQEVGGRAIRELSRYQTGGDVIGRTQWVGMPSWAQGFGMDRPEIKAAVEKAIGREKLGAKQVLLLQVMLEEIAKMQRPIPF